MKAFVNAVWKEVKRVNKPKILLCAMMALYASAAIRLVRCMKQMEDQTDGLLLTARLNAENVAKIVAILDEFELR